EIILERNENYWGDKPMIKTIIWKIIPEAGTREAALLAGDVDVAFLPPASDKDRLEEDPNVKLYTPITNRILLIGLMPKGPLLDERVRKALNYAVDKEAIVDKVLYGLGVVADAPIPPHFFGYTPMDVYEYNPDLARQLLEEAGYGDGLTLKLMHPTGRYLQDKQVAEAVQAYLQEIGIEVELITMDWPSFVAEILKPTEETTFDLVLVGWGPGVADAHFTLYAQFHSSVAIPNGLGIARYMNEEVDTLLDQAMKELDPERRKELYRRAIEIIWDDAPWIFLYTQKNLLAVNKNLEGVFIHPGGEMFFFYSAYFT
ncbi:MAG TPA: glutathione ABC transporter substrate-binding protein, partial [Thermoprotei archaeon]|nr:glutathione ABC transporter substrate-binding protein [Thermoprotei archaeon]